MLIVRSPLRFSFFGGGTDMHEYYKRDYGCVLGEAINKYVYVIVNRRFDKDIRISYRENEIVSNVDDIKHKLIRESLKEFGIYEGIEVVTIADVPGTGTGLGSSSSLTVGLCNAFSMFIGKPLRRDELAEVSCYLEIQKNKSPIGKQDQYFATYGGLLFLRFDKDEKVSVERLNLNNNTKKEMEENFLGFYSGISRKADSILVKQKERTSINISFMDQMRDLAEQGRDCIRDNDLAEFSQLLDKGWKLKKSLVPEISNDIIDSIYKKALEAGATGGKLSGAGSGGFLFFYCEPKYHEKVRESLKNLKELDFGIDNSGSVQLH